MQLSFDHPYLSVAPVSSSFRSHFQEALPLRPATGYPHLFEIFFATTVTSLWRSLLAKLAAIKGTVREASKLSQRQGAKTESQTLLSSENVKISSQAGRKNKQEGQVTRTLSLGNGHVDALQLNHVQFRFQKHT